MTIFERFPFAPGEQCQHCSGQETVDRRKVRESPKTGFWCRKHWHGGPRCSEEGCDEPVMRIKDGGDGERCRAHMMPDSITYEDRVAALRGEHMLADIQRDNHRGNHIKNNFPNDKQIRGLTKTMERKGIVDKFKWSKTYLYYSSLSDEKQPRK